MKNKLNIWVGIIAVLIIILFVGYGLSKNSDPMIEGNNDSQVNEEENNEQEISQLSIGTISTVGNIMNLVSESFEQYNAQSEILVTESNNLMLFDSLVQKEYDIIITSQKIDELALTVDLNDMSYEELLFASLNNDELSYEDNFLYCYILSENTNNQIVNHFLQYFYSQPLNFLNRDDVYALNENIYEETLNYVKLLEVY